MGEYRAEFRELGVGFGALHQMWAKSRPRRLYSDVDLIVYLWLYCWLLLLLPSALLFACW